MGSSCSGCVLCFLILFSHCDCCCGVGGWSLLGGLGLGGNIWGRLVGGGVDSGRRKISHGSLCLFVDCFVFRVGWSIIIFIGQEIGSDWFSWG